MLPRTKYPLIRQPAAFCNGRILYFLSHTCIVIFFLSGDYRAQTSNLVSEFVSKDVLQGNTSSNEDSKSLDPLKVKDQWTSDNSTVVDKKVSKVTNLPFENESLFINTGEEYDEDYDDYGLSFDVPEVLFDLEPEEMVLSLTQGAAPPQGKRKPFMKEGFSPDQEKELLRLHNFYRGNVTPPAADMSFIEWDDHLKRIAQDWANTCSYVHGFPKNHTYPGYMGQNLYWGFDPTGVKAMHMWYEEYEDYSLENLTCTPNKMCGHYTQMVWSGHKLVGCGRKWCKQRRNHFIVCHYYPSGNVHGIAPYFVGRPCSQCLSDNGGLCTNNLCVTEDQCQRNPESCDPYCPLECQNCGVLNQTSCKCSCADGWESLDCSHWCRNKDGRCGTTPGWPTFTSCSAHRIIANEYCRKMCRKCRGVEDVNSTSVCCSGIECDAGYVEHQQKNQCECRLLCPGPKCYEYRELSLDEMAKESTSSSETLLVASLIVLFPFIVHVFFCNIDVYV